jgi:hypothetical protein
LEVALTSAAAVAEPTDPENGAVEGEESEVVEDADAPAGPSPAEEAAFQAEENGDVDVLPVALRSEPEEPEPIVKGELPALDDLIKRIPAEVLETMEELFRAKFVKVERVAKKHLKR